MKEYIVIGRTNGTTRNGSPYAALKVANNEETLNISVWDMAPTTPPVVGQTVIIRSMKDNMGKKSCGIQDITPGTFPQENHPLYNIIPRPIKKDIWDSCIKTLTDYCTDEKLKEIIAIYADKLFKPYSTAPAATTVHHAFPGGLLNHTYQMLNMLAAIYPALPYPIKIERCILAIIFHDYGKVFEYKDGEPTEDMYLLGHIYMSAHNLHKILDDYGIDREEIKRIIHCILAHHGQLEYGSPVMPCTQEAAIVSYLDNISAKTDTMEGTGNMEYVHALSTHVIK